jgi:hypothetical protein
MGLPIIVPSGVSNMGLDTQVAAILASAVSADRAKNAPLAKALVDMACAQSGVERARFESHFWKPYRDQFEPRVMVVDEPAKGASKEPEVGA